MKTINLTSNLSKNLKLFFLSLIISITSCKNECEEPETIGDSAMAIDFFDRSSNDYLIKENSSKFSINDVKLYNEFGEILPLKFEINILPEMPSNRYYRVSISSLFESSDDMVNEVSKRLFIDFNSDRDTIDYTLKTKKTECGSTFEYLRVNYNGIEIGNATNTTFIAVKVTKD